MEYKLNISDTDRNGSRPKSQTIWSTDSKNDSNLVEVSTKRSFYKRRRKVEIGFFITILALLALVAILVYVSINWFTTSKELKSLCRSPQCIHAASSILHTIDESVHPCEDFYAFACGNFNAEHPIPLTTASTDWFADRSERALAKVKEYLQRNESVEETFSSTEQARIMYRACMDNDKLEELGLEPLKETLQSINLPLVPLLHEPKEGEEDEVDTSNNINHVIALVKLMVGKDYIFHSGVYPDVYNRTRNKITILSPMDKGILPSIYADKRQYLAEVRLKKALTNNEVHVVNAWKRYVSSVIRYFLKKTNVTNVPDEDIRKSSLTILQLTTKIRQLINNENITMGGFENPNKMTLSQLQNLTDEAAQSVNLTSKIVWSEYFDVMFGAANMTVDFNETQLAVHNLEYYRAVSILLANHTEHEILLTVWWDVVFSLIPYTKEELRTFRSTFLTEALGEPSSLPRDSYCSSIIWSIMDMAIANGIIDDVDINSTKADITEMIDYIQLSFKRFVNEADWIDDETKSAILDKAKYIHKNIGYPDWIANETSLEQYYEGLEVSEETHMLNFLNVVQISVITMLKTVNETNSYDFPEFDPREVNANYIPQENSITIPLGMLQFPFYDMGIDALNYGAIGSIIGHELTHAFDTTGRKYDKHGNVNDWWTEKTINDYNERVDCFIEMYDDYYVEDADEYVNGNLTLGENIADNGGLKDSYYGYKMMMETEEKESLKLPGLEHYTDEQLFYIGYAHAWCENWTPQSMKYGLMDEHSPNYIRVLGGASNSKEFSKAFNCPAKSPMNPVNKCKLW